jgi:plastocyanin
LFTYAAEADNQSKDLILIVGAKDKSRPGTSPTGTPSPTVTPTPPAGAAHVVNIGQSGSSYRDVQSGTSVSTIHVGDTVQWVWMGGPHSTTSGSCMAGGYYGGTTCGPDAQWDSGVRSPSYTFSYKFTEAGTFRYFCEVHLGSMVGTIQVLP